MNLPSTQWIARIRFWLAMGAISLTALSAAAHSASTAWLSLRVQESAISGSWEIALRDVDLALEHGLDSNGDGNITWGELRSRRKDVETWALRSLDVLADAVLVPMRVDRFEVSTVSGIESLRLELSGVASRKVQSLALEYRLLFQEDPQHRGLVRVSSPDHPDGVPGILSPERSRLQVDLGRAGSASIRAFIREGVHHIATGYDHLLFLLALLLPAVVVRGESGWRAAGSFRPVMARVLQVVTAFTVAHSITLTLAAMDWVRPSPRWVECCIALSIGVAALGNLKSRVVAGHRVNGPSTWHRAVSVAEARPWLIPFGFGLIHGFGFAEGLHELGLSRGHLAGPLLGFNLGVEAGQLAAVLLVLPVLFWIRRSNVYRSWGLAVASWVIVLMSTGWGVERVFEIRLMPF